jgi:uncharacterized protein (DUF58 family)
MDPRTILKAENLELLASQVVEGFITGMHKSPFHGFSVEFAEHRLYNTGESTRNIDWKLYARTDKLFVKRFEEETNLRCAIFVDTSSSMYYPESEQMNKLKFSVLAAASLLQLLKRQRDASGLFMFDEDIHLQTEVKSSSTHYKNLSLELSSLLEKNPPQQKKSNIAQSLHLLAERIHRRSLVIIFSDMFEYSEQEDELFEALQHLKYNKHEVILFHTTDRQKELEFDLENRPYLLEDAETGEKVKLFPSEVKDIYLEKMNHFYKMLKARCAQYRIDFIETDVQQSVEQVLLSFFTRRKKMRIS